MSPRRFVCKCERPRVLDEAWRCQRCGCRLPGAHEPAPQAIGFEAPSMLPPGARDLHDLLWRLRRLGDTRL